MLQLSFILLILISLNWRSSSFRQYQFFRNFDGPNAFFPNSTGPWSRLVGKSLKLVLKGYQQTTVAGNGLKQGLSKALTVVGKLGRNDSQIGRSYSAKLLHFLSV